VSAWLAGVGPEDRALSYSCLVCGRVEHVPPTEAEDAEYEATLPTWPDWTPVVQPVAAIAVMPEPVAAVIEAPPARRPVVRIVTMPVQRVGATDDNLLALHVA
jgi:hypothetical protein